jgi:hypothetical protein
MPAACGTMARRGPADRFDGCDRRGGIEESSLRPRWLNAAAVVRASSVSKARFSGDAHESSASAHNPTMVSFREEVFDECSRPSNLKVSSD